MSMAADKRTALLLAGVLAGYAGHSFWRGHPARAEGVLACALTLAAAAFSSPAFAAWFHGTWLRTTRAIAAVHTLAVLALLYFGPFSVYRVWGRLTGRDALGRRARPRTSYWVRRTRTYPDHSQFERLY